MQLINDFINGYYYYIKHGEISMHADLPGFISGILDIVEQYTQFDEETVEKLTAYKFCKETFTLPFPLLYDSSYGIGNAVKLFYTLPPVKIKEKEYYIYTYWTPEQISRIHSWFIETFWGGHDQCLADWANAICNDGMEIVADE